MAHHRFTKHTVLAYQSLIISLRIRARIYFVETWQLRLRLRDVLSTPLGLPSPSVDVVEGNDCMLSAPDTGQNVALDYEMSPGVKTHLNY